MRATFPPRYFRHLFATTTAALGLCALTGCGAKTTSYVRAPEASALGRVVVYRNGIAYFERRAVVNGDTLRLSVPADKVDDFLKSLTVVDAHTGAPAPISYPTNLGDGAREGMIDMNIRLVGPGPHELRLSYVTEAPSWKPSYRILLEDDRDKKGPVRGEVTLEGWAVIDNTSGEDWERVNLGVGSSSALSFRFDLQSLRLVHRDVLQPADQFAVAPPVGAALFGGEPGTQTTGVAEISDDSLSEEASDAKDDVAPSKSVARDKGKVAVATAAAAPMAKRAGGRGDESERRTREGRASGRGAPAQAPAASAVGPAKPTASPEPNLDALSERLKRSGGTVMVEGFAADDDADKAGAALRRAAKVRSELLKRGLNPEAVVAIGRGQVPGHQGGVRIVEVAAASTGTTHADPEALQRDPIGTSHFESKTPMTVQRGTSAMVSIYRGPTQGEVVYLFDPESPRGNGSFPFRAVKIRNPTESTLDSGPVTVFGQGRFIGEGISEAIPPHASAFVPFALDRQIVVETNDGERDQITRILSVQRGVFSTEVQHTRVKKLVFHNRLATRAKVGIRHTVPPGFTLRSGAFTDERVGNSHLLGIELEPGSQREVVIEESTPVLKTTDLRAPLGLELVRTFVSEGNAPEALRTAVAKLVEHQKKVANLEQRITTLKEQMGEYRTRMDELHAQVVTLRAVRTAGPLMRDLEKKLQDMGDRLSKSTIDLVGLEEELMLTRIRFQDAAAELTLEPTGH